MAAEHTRVWQDYDSALWHTCTVLAAAGQDRLHEVPGNAVPFAMQLGGAEERIFGSGQFVLSSWEAPGDGTYHRTGGFFMATGGAALALTGVVAGVTALRNSARRREAAAMAQPRWLPVDQGLIHVGTHGFYLQTINGFHQWGWNCVHSTIITGPGSIWVQGQSVQGPISWRINSHWAELAFVLWATTCHPHHPQLIDGSWLPPHWITWATHHGYPPPQLDPH